MIHPKNPNRKMNIFLTSFHRNLPKSAQFVAWKIKIVFQNMHAHNKVIDKLNYYRINNGRCHEAQGRHFHLEKKNHIWKDVRSYKRVNTINFNLQHPKVQPPTPTMVPWLPKQLKEKFKFKDWQIWTPKDYLADIEKYSLPWS